MLPAILIVIGTAVVVFLVVAALRPSAFRISRAIAISAPPPAVFARVNDFHHWEAWSPWARRDPAMKKRYEGAPAGAGAVYAWDGNKEVGEGCSTITESRPDELIRIKLDFVRPFACSNTAEFTFRPEGGQTVVTWSLFGRNGFVARTCGLFMDMDKMVGGQFEQGLSQLKSVVESSRGQ